MFKDTKFKSFTEGGSAILVQDGKVDKPAMKRVKISEEEFEESVREHGIEGIENVKLCILKADGNISVISMNKTWEHTNYTGIKRNSDRKNL